MATSPAHTMLDPSSVIFNEKDRSVLIGLQLHLRGQLSPVQAVRTFQDGHFDELLGSGFFRALPQSHKVLASWDYIDSDRIMTERNVPFEVQYNQESNITTLEIVLGQCDFETGLDEELGAITQELNAFVEAGYATAWAQFPLTGQAQPGVNTTAVV